MKQEGSLSFCSCSLQSVTKKSAKSTQETRREQSSSTASHCIFQKRSEMGDDAGDHLKSPRALQQSSCEHPYLAASAGRTPMMTILEPPPWELNISPAGKAEPGLCRHPSPPRVYTPHPRMGTETWDRAACSHHADPSLSP